MNPFVWADYFRSNKRDQQLSFQGKPYLHEPSLRFQAGFRTWSNVLAIMTTTMITEYLLISYLR